jgi:hypothetical protein
MATRRIFTAVSALALCLAACSSAGTAIRSSGGPSVSARALPHHRTVVLDPSTGNVVEPGTPSSPKIVILNPVTGQIVRLIH